MLAQDESDLLALMADYGVSEMGTAGAGINVPTDLQEPVSGGNMLGQDDGDESNYSLVSSDDTTNFQNATDLTQLAVSVPSVDADGTPITQAGANGAAYSNLVIATADQLNIDPSQVMIDSGGMPTSYIDQNGNLQMISSSDQAAINAEQSTTATTSAQPGVSTSTATGTSAIQSLLSAITGGGATIGGGSGKASVPMASTSPTTTSGLSSLTSSPILMLGLAGLAIWAFMSMSGKKS